MARRPIHFSLPSALAVFPLTGALLLPRARLPLQIFEPRYLAMLDDALRSEHRLIGMFQPKDEDKPPQLYETGCAGRVVSFTETDDGRYLIALNGIARFRIAEELEGFTPFRRVRPDWSAYEQDLAAHSGGLFEGNEREVFLGLLRRYLEATSLSTDWDALSKAEDETLVNALAMLCPFSPQEKQALLEAESLEDCLRDLRALMEFAVAAPSSGGGDLQ